MKSLHVWLANHGQDHTKLISELESLGLPIYYHHQPEGAKLYKSSVAYYDYAKNSKQSFYGSYEISRFIARQLEETYISPFNNQRQ